MPHTASAKKRLRQAKKITMRHRAVKQNLKQLIRGMRKVFDQKDATKAKEFYLKLQKAFDKAAQKGVMKKNAAARKKSRWAKRLRLLGAAPTP